MKPAEVAASDYLMENDEEVLRLDWKTDDRVTEKQALWGGLKPGMRVADIGCGSGKTTFKLAELVQPGGSAVGVDIGEQRIDYARRHYGRGEIEFHQGDARESLEKLGTFDFVWVRFLLEYYRSNSFEIVKNLSKILKPGGILCLIDLDYNCLNHFGLPPRVEKTIATIVDRLEESRNFDPYVGRKLYSFLYDLGFEDLDVNIAPHHLFFGEMKESDIFNWTKKVEISAKKLGFQFEDYAGGYEEFFAEFKAFFSDPRRFTYTPVICCRGRKSAG
jgi:ubiquinone/menaquinone biosynthesis C-methylase UbiE